MSIWPGDLRPRYDYWCGFVQSHQPHLNVLFNMRAPMTAEVAVAMHHLLDRVLMHQHAQLWYPTLWIKPVANQEKLNGW